jgi:2,4-dienoyl-CoA reductase-like NADH-dependent reductase (Old Yellow Enzyme family)
MRSSKQADLVQETQAGDVAALRRDAQEPVDLGALFEPYRLNAALTLKNRILLAPCTRNRAEPDLAPTRGAIRHYAERAACGLLITEATIIARHVQGYVDTPGIFLDSHVERWSQVTDAVHRAGGSIFLQLWHPGRMAHSYYSGAQPLAPSAVLDEAARRQSRGVQLHHEMPREMTESEIAEAISQYRSAAHKARKAGFDGVEIHGANGYLPEQFLRLHTNRRSDAWGGSPSRRARFTLEVVDACSEAFGPERVGLRLSPAAYFSEMRYTPGDNDAFLAVFESLNARKIAYLHTGIVEDDQVHYLDGTSSAYLRRHYSGTLIGNGGYTAPAAAAHIRAGVFDLVAFGKLFLANPDLVERLHTGSPLQPYSRALLDHFE